MPPAFQVIRNPVQFVRAAILSPCGRIHLKGRGTDTERRNFAQLVLVRSPAPWISGNALIHRVGAAIRHGTTETTPLIPVRSIRRGSNRRRRSNSRIRARWLLKFMPGGAEPPNPSLNTLKWLSKLGMLRWGGTVAVIEAGVNGRSNYRNQTSSMTSAISSGSLRRPTRKPPRKVELVAA